MPHSVNAEGLRSRAPLSFCFIMPFHIYEDRGGGAEVQAWFLARELARRGFRTSYVAQSVKGKEGTTETLEGVTVHWVRYAHHFRWSNAGAYYRALSRADADIVVQRMTAFTTGVAALWCRRRRRKFVWICSDNAAPRKWHFLRNQRGLNRAARPWLPKRIAFLFNALVTDLARHWGINRIWLAFTQNEAQRALLKEEYGIDSRRILSGHPPPATSIQLEDRLASPTVLWVAGLAPRKRPEKFIELARSALGTPLRFIMVGGYFDQSRLEKLFNGAPANLEWRGKLPFEAALAHFDNAAFFVNTSAPDGEGFPNTFVQAWLRGVPVFSLGVDPDGIIMRNGLGFVSDDPRELLAQMQTLASDADRYRATSAAIKRFAEANHSIAAMCDRFLASLPSPLQPGMHSSPAQALQRS